jgi:hypothetical protein
VNNLHNNQLYDWTPGDLPGWIQEIQDPRRQSNAARYFLMHEYGASGSTTT